MDLYTYVGNDPIDITDPSGEDFLGFTAGATAEAGLSTCSGGYCNSRAEGGQVSGYGAVFWGGKRMTAGFGLAKGTLTGHTFGKDYVKGAYGGLGAGVTFGNATNNDQLKGPFDTTSWDFFFLSVQLAKSGSVWQESITVGPGAVGAESRYDTNTKTLGGSDPESKSGQGRAASSNSKSPSGSGSSNGSGKSQLFGQTVKMGGSRICAPSASGTDQGQRPNSC